MESMMVKPVFLILLGCVLQAQAASDSTFITFNGTVLANTCTLSTGSRDQIMVLGSIADRDIKGKGTTGGEKEVNMVLRDCGASATAVVVSVQGRQITMTRWHSEMPFRRAKGSSRRWALFLSDRRENSIQS